MTIPDDDRGFTLGDGLFETVLAEAGVLVSFEAHAERMIGSSIVLGLTPPEPAALRAAGEGALAAANLQASHAAVRLTWTAGSGGRGLERPTTLGPRLVATAAAVFRPSAAATLITADVRRNETSVSSRHKTLSYLDNVIARRQALDAGADEALLLNTRGDVACAAAANIIWLKDGVLFTPALTCGVLAGIMRAEVMETAARLGMRVEEVAAGPGALRQADAVFLTNSLIGLRSVAALDGYALDQQSSQVTVELARGRR